MRLEPVVGEQYVDIPITVDTGGVLSKLSHHSSFLSGVLSSNGSVRIASGMAAFLSDVRRPVLSRIRCTHTPLIARCDR